MFIGTPFVLYSLRCHCSLLFAELLGRNKNLGGCFASAVGTFINSADLAFRSFSDLPMLVFVALSLLNPETASWQAFFQLHAGPAAGLL